MMVSGYETLQHILDKAYEQAASGKGSERHALSAVGSLPWEAQPILAIARQVGPGGPAQQIMKKAQESVWMAARQEYDRAKAEALGVIVYAAALYQLFDEMDTSRQG